jgi:hypothetical protein
MGKILNIFWDSFGKLAMHVGSLKQTLRQFFSWFSLFVCGNITRGVSHCGLAIYIKKYLKEEKNYGNSNISSCKNIISKNPLKETKILQDIITL